VWVAEEMLSEPAELTAEDESLILVRATSQVENLLFQQEKNNAAAAAYVVTTPVTSLIRSAGEAGLNVTGLVDACRLDRMLLTKLEGRQIRAVTVPPRLIQLLADVLRRSVADITTFLQQPPRIVPGSSFLSRGTPQAASQESFADAVRSSGLSDELREYWLGETRNHDPPE
jgi:hypothetical protein